MIQMPETLPKSLCTFPCGQSQDCSRFVGAIIPDSATKVYYTAPPIGAQQGKCHCYRSKNGEIAKAQQQGEKIS